MRLKLLVSATIIFMTGVALSQDSLDESLKYLKQKPPGKTPQVFAPDIVSKKDEFEYGSVFSKDGKDFYYAVTKDGKAEIRHMKLKNGNWTKPECLIFHDIYSYNDPFLSPDETRLYFISDMPLNGKGDKKDIDIWYAERKEGAWGDPVNAGSMINSDKNEYYISFTQNGTMYFASNKNTTAENHHNFDIYASKSVKGEFQQPVKLGDAVNTDGYETDVFVAYDESYIIFCSEREGGYGRGDLYISFKKDDGTWTKAKNMGNTINTDSYEFCPFVTKDGKYFFYSSKMDIYWVDASIINDLR